MSDEVRDDQILDLPCEISPHSQLDEAPKDRAYPCEWQDCTKQFKAVKMLMTHICQNHTGVYIAELGICVTYFTRKNFENVLVKDGTLQWNSVTINFTDLKGNMQTQPLDLDPDVLYQKSKPISFYRLVINTEKINIGTAMA